MLAITKLYKLLFIVGRGMHTITIPTLHFTAATAAHSIMKHEMSRVRERGRKCERKRRNQFLI
jgi:hypothetical protein